MHRNRKTKHRGGAALKDVQENSCLLAGSDNRCPICDEQYNEGLLKKIEFDPKAVKEAAERAVAANNKSQSNNHENDKPKCIHSVCLNCANSMINVDILNCPLCREGFTARRGGEIISEYERVINAEAARDRSLEQDPYVTNESLNELFQLLTNRIQVWINRYQQQPARSFWGIDGLNDYASNNLSILANAIKEMEEIKKMVLRKETYRNSFSDMRDIRVSILNNQLKRTVRMIGEIIDTTDIRTFTRKIKYLLDLLIKQRKWLEYIFTIKCNIRDFLGRGTIKRKQKKRRSKKSNRRKKNKRKRKSKRRR